MLQSCTHFVSCVSWSMWRGGQRQLTGAGFLLPPCWPGHHTDVTSLGAPYHDLLSQLISSQVHLRMTGNSVIQGSHDLTLYPPSPSS